MSEANRSVVREGAAAGHVRGQQVSGKGGACGAVKCTGREVARHSVTLVFGNMMDLYIVQKRAFHEEKMFLIETISGMLTIQPKFAA